MFSFMPAPTEETQSQERIFSRLVKQACWDKAEIVPGRDPSRWRFDVAGNIVCNRLKGCDGCLCHEYDHIFPFSKGGKTDLGNCQILQTRSNRMKGNEDNEPRNLMRYSCARKFVGASELDLIEMAVYGDVKGEAGETSCRCKSVIEFEEAWRKARKSKKQRERDQLPNCP